jgi:DNA modification methylase
MTKTLPPAMASRIEMWPVSRLIPYERNSRTHSKEQIEQIAASMIQFGFTQPILVNESDGGILAGHGRLKAALTLGMNEVPVVPLDHLTEAQRRAYIIADNKLAENAGWDEVLLRTELEALKADTFNLDVLGFSATELEMLLDDSGDVLEGETDADDAPPLPETPVSRLGDLWLLGNHRLIVGDSTWVETVSTLVDGAEVDLILTDPPYNVGYGELQRSRRNARRGKEKLHEDIEGDTLDPDSYRAFLDGFLPHYRANLKLDGSMYVFYAQKLQNVWEEALERHGFEVRSHIIWAKNTMVLSFSRYKYMHEPLLYCHHAGSSDVWYGDQTQTTLWFEKKPSASREHPTMKPVDLLQRPLVNSSKRGDLVLDLFGGAGSTLIACERLGRHARLAEISPVYADVILRRWSQYTRRQPILAAGGSSFAQIERERLVLARSEPALPQAVSV